MKTQKAILAVVAGMAAGAAIGVLFAPHKGADTRKKISKKTGELADLLNERIDQRFDDLLTAVTGRVKKAPAPNGSTHARTETLS
jgi:gas vesicle protein